MRDTFVLLWVAFLFIGVIGSIVSGIRKQVQRAQAAAPDRQPPRRIPAQWQPPPGQLPEWLQRMASQVSPPPPQRVVPQPVVPKRPAAPSPVAELPHELPAPRRRGHRLFESRKAIVQAVIAAEVLGKPLALRDE